jgi:hypothetical protein
MRESTVLLYYQASLQLASGYSHSNLDTSLVATCFTLNGTQMLLPSLVLVTSNHSTYSPDAYIPLAIFSFRS